MKTLKFQGYSDDTFGEYGVTGEDVDNCASEKPIQCLISSNSGSLLVVGQHSVSHIDGSCWVIGLSRESEDISLPDWAIRLQDDFKRNSPILEIDVPDDVTLRWYNDGREV